MSKQTGGVPILMSLLVYAAKGAALAAGAFGVAKLLGPTMARDLGDQAANGALDVATCHADELAHDAGASAGEGFAEGMARVHTLSNLVSGERGRYRR